MEKIKDPAMILSITNSVGLVGVTAYFYKRLEKLEQMEKDNLKLTEMLKTIVGKLNNTDKDNQQKMEALHALNQQVKALTQKVDDLPLDDIDDDLAEVVSVLAEKDIFVDLPSQIPPPPPTRRQAHSNNKKDNVRGNSSNNSGRNSFKGDSSRDSQRQNHTAAKASRAVREPVTNDDDTDLINAVRTQGRS